MEELNFALGQALRVLDAVPVGPVEPTGMTVIESSDGSFARLVAPRAVRAADVTVAPHAFFARPGAKTVICVVKFPPFPSEELEIVLNSLALHTRACVALSTLGASPAADVALPARVVIEAGRIDIVVVIPGDAPLQSTVTLRGLTVAGEAVPLSETPPALNVFDGPEDLTPEQAAQLHAWLGGGSAGPRTWIEVYRGTRDGFLAKDFHSKCDSTPRVLVLAREKKMGWLYGGFTAVGFLPEKGDRAFYADPDAFLFSLVSPLGRPEKLESLKAGKDIFYLTGYGASFGCGCDLYICSAAHENGASGTCVKQGTSFALPSGTGRYPLAEDQQGGWLLSEVAAFVIPA